MRSLILSLLLMCSFQAYAEQCNKETVMENSKYNVTIHGDGARLLWIGLAAPEQQPSSKSEQSFGYEVTAKYGTGSQKGTSCWNYVPAETNDKGVTIGPANCEAFTCTVIHK